MTEISLPEFNEEERTAIEILTGIGATRDAWIEMLHNYAKRAVEIEREIENPSPKFVNAAVREDEDLELSPSLITLERRLGVVLAELKSDIAKLNAKADLAIRAYVQEKSK